MFSWVFPLSLCGDLAPDIHLHIHGILVFFIFRFTAGRALLGKSHSVRNLSGFGGLVFWSFLFGSTSVSSLSSIVRAFSCCDMSPFYLSSGSS